MAGDAIWLDVLPALAGFGNELAKGTAKAGEDAGKATGNAWSRAFAGAAGDGGASVVAAELQDAEDKAKRSVQAATTEIGKARAAQKEAAARVVTAEQTYKDAVEKSGEGSARAEAASLRLEAARDKEKIAADKVEASEDAVKAAHRELTEATKQLEDATSDSNEEASKSEGAWGKVSDALGGGLQKVNDFAGGMGGMVTQVAGAVGVAATFSSAWDQAMDLSNGVAKVTAQLDLTSEQSQRAGDVAGALYADAYGDSMEDVTEATSAVMSTFKGMRDASAEDLQEVTGQAMSLSKAFDLDVNDAVAATAQLFNQGLAPDATSAMDLITASLQQVPAALRGEVMDATTEYSQFFSQLGLDGQEAMGLLVSASVDGQYGIDKMGDALKELTIRSSDMSTTSVQAYQAAGLSAEDMSARFLAGGDTARGALDELVTGLQGIEDPTARANAAIGLFGTPLEDLSTDDIPAFLDQLSSMDSSLGDVSGSAAEMDETMSGATDPVETLKRSFMGILTDGLEPLVGPVQAFAQWAADTPGVMEAVAVALGVVALAWAGMTLAASPWLLIGAAIAAVIAGIILAVQNWGAITDWMGEKWGQFTGWVGEKWDTMTGWVTDKATTVTGAVIGAWELMKAGLKAGWDWIDQNVLQKFRDGLSALGDAGNAVKDTIGNAWAKIKSLMADPVNFVIKTVYTDGLKHLVEKVADTVGLNVTLPTIKPIAYAQGGITGVLPGYAPGHDSILSILSPGEGVLVPEAVRGLGPSFVGWANRFFSNGRSNGGTGTGMTPASTGTPAFADGGIVGWFQDRARGLANFVADPLGAVADLISKPVEALLGDVASGVWGDILKGGIRTVLGGIGSWFKGKSETELGNAGLVGAARRALGTPYVWGGSTIPPGVDCSGLVYWAAQQMGLGWPRLTAAGYQSASARKNLSTAVPGDLLFWGNPASHVAIYESPGWMIHAPQPGDHVREAGIYGTPSVGTYRGGNSTGTYENLVQTTAARSSNSQTFARNLRASLYDSGGPLYPGFSLAYNGTGKTETVLTNEQAQRRDSPASAFTDRQFKELKDAVREGAREGTADRLGPASREQGRAYLGG